MTASPQTLGGSNGIIRSASVGTGRDVLSPWLNALFGAEPDGALIEVRHRLEAGMGQRFFDVREPGLVEYVLDLGQRTDVYVGVAPRTRRAGGRDAISNVHALWADVDGAESLEALRRFRPLPAVVVRSGSPDSVHAYWPLWPPAEPDEVERANRRAAHALGADIRSTDAARVLRPPGTLNHKTSPPAPVELAHLAVEVFTVEEVVGRLPDPPRGSVDLSRRRDNLSSGHHDLLGSQDAALALIDRYAPDCELRASGAGRLHGRCPLPAHEDRNPSFGLFPDGGYVCSCGSGDIVRLYVELQGEVWQDSMLPQYRREMIDVLGTRLLHAPLRQEAA